MTSGVYLLTFKNGDTYIGKSNDMERRWIEHGDKLAKGKAAKNMQEAYRRSGFPNATSLIKCHVDHIDIMESYYIWKLQPNLNSAATSFLSIEDAETIEMYADSLEYSTGTHLRTAVILQRKLELVSDELIFLKEHIKVLEVKRTKEEIVTETGKVAASYMKRNEELLEEIEKLNDEANKLHRENTQLKKRTLWNFLFG